MDRLQMIVTAIAAIIPAIISYFVARYQGKTDIKKLSESSKNEIDRLIKQHEINLDSLKEKHRLEMDAKEREHEYRLEILQREHENEMIRREKELEDSVKYQAAGNAANALITGIIGSAFSSDEVKDAIGGSLAESLQQVKNGTKSK